MKLWHLGTWGLLSVMMMGAMTARATEIVAGPMVGHVSETAARVWMQLSTSERVTVRCFDTTKNREMGAITVDVEGPSPFIYDAPISALEPNRDYRIEVEFDGKPVKLPGPAVAIRTAPSPGEAAVLTLAFGSGVNAAKFRRMPVFKTIESLRPRAFLFLGNTGYLPEKEDEFPRTRKAAFRFICEMHQQTRLAPDLQRLLRIAANYAVWDDHDFGTTAADHSFVFNGESRVAFQRYWPNPDYGTPENPGVYYSFTLGDVDVFVLDERTYRDAAKDPERKTMLGDEQLAWLQAGLKSSRAKFKIIAGGTPMLTEAGAGETWGDYRAEREAFVEWLFANHIDGVLLLSGNRQFGELLLRKGEEKDTSRYPLFELSSSPLAAEVAGREVLGQANALRVGGPVGEVNFGTLEFAGPRGKRHVTLRLRDVAGDVKVEQTVFESQLKAQ